MRVNGANDPSATPPDGFNTMRKQNLWQPSVSRSAYYSALPAAWLALSMSDEAVHYKN